jgi:hypothetical protein
MIANQLELTRHGLLWGQKNLSGFDLGPDARPGDQREREPPPAMPDPPAEAVRPAAHVTKKYSGDQDRAPKHGQASGEEDGIPHYTTKSILSHAVGDLRGPRHPEVAKARAWPGRMASSPPPTSGVTHPYTKVVGRLRREMLERAPRLFV